MKNKELQELKPVYIHEANYSVDNDTNLIDIAMVLVKRWKMLIVIFTIFLALGVTAALLKPYKYTYSTSIEIGSQFYNGAVVPLESPDTLLAKLNHSFIPQVLNEHQLANLNDKKQYEIKASVPTKSTIIVLETIGTEDQATLMISLLNNTSLKVTQDHKRIYEAIKQNHIVSIDLAEAELIALKTKNIVDPDELQLSKTRIAAHKSQLANLLDTREVFSPIKHLKSTGGSKKLIIILAGFTGILFGVISAFFAEFIAKVREATLQSKQ